MKKLYVFDLDGTIANLEHRLHLIEGPLKDWNTFSELCDKDEPITWIIDLVKAIDAYLLEEDVILILSARIETVREKTIAWLEKHGVPFNELFMRKDGDYRPDFIIKEEMLRYFLDFNPDLQVQFIVEDRQSVVDMWRDKGYKVLQCDAWKEIVK